MRSKFLFLCLLAPLAACPPTLNDDDDATGDDDDVTPDDDDVTADDDDVTPDDDDVTPDDDDVTPSDDDDLCSDLGEGSIWFDASAGGIDGMWLEGELSWSGDTLSVSPEFGPAFGLPIYAEGVDLDRLLGDITGPGRLFLVATSWGAWTANGVVAVETSDVLRRVILSSAGATVPSLAEFGIDLQIDPLESQCTQGLVDMQGCGLAAALGMQVAMATPWTASEWEAWPGDNALMSQWEWNLYESWRIFETNCDDFDTTRWSWSLNYVGEMDG